MSDDKPIHQFEDQELNDLLDSALKDFNQESVPETRDDNSSKNKEKAIENVEENPASEDSAKVESDVKNKESVAENKDLDKLDEAWAKDFMKQALDQFEKTVLPVMMEESNSGPDGADGDGANTDFQFAISKALSELSANSENLQNEDLSELLTQTSLEDGASGILPFMQGVLHHLLSKELFYQPLKEYVDKYPEWLEGKKDSVSSEDYDKLTKQLELFRKICEEFEKEKDDDTEEIKKKRAETILALLEETQNYSPLVEELLEDQPNPFNFDGDIDGAIPPIFRGMDTSQNCSVM